MKKSQLHNLILESYAEVISELNEAPDHLYYIKAPRTNKALQNSFAQTIETFFDAKITDIVDDDGSGNVIMYFPKKDFDPDMIEKFRDDIPGDEEDKDMFMQNMTNFPGVDEADDKDDYGRPHVDPKGSRTYIEPEDMLPSKRFKDLMKESLLDDLSEEEEEPQPEEEPDNSAGPETVLEDATDTILSKFPTVKQAIIKLQTEDFKEFVDSIDWISPRPTSFRVNLKNGQDYILKWTGKTFEVQILGKKYLLSNISDYQQAIDKLALLYREAPMKGAGEEDIAADTDTGGGGGGGGDFPGEEGGAEGGEDLGGDDAGGDLGGDEGGEDLSDEPIDFEAGEEG